MNNMGKHTIAIHGAYDPKEHNRAVAVPIYQTTSYAFESTDQAANLFALKEGGHIYTRISNPTTEVLENRIAELEEGSGAIATSSGMAAIFLAITNIAKYGDHIISSASLYGGTETLFRYTLKRFGIKVSFLDELSKKNIESTITDNTKLIYTETIGNPNGTIPDFEEISSIARKHKIPLIVDNTFAPTLWQPFDHGCNIIVYSTTKWIGGHGTSIGGMIVDGGNFDWSSGRFPEFITPDASYHGIVYWKVFSPSANSRNTAFIAKAKAQGMRNIGLAPSPINSFLILQGVETLPLRMEKHCENALKLAKFLKKDRRVKSVNFLGFEDHPYHNFAKKYLNGKFGSLFCFELKGGYEAGKRFIENLKITKHLANVGDAKTLVIHPSSTTHQQLSEEAKIKAGVSDGLIRVSVGLENIEDIIEDFTQTMGKQ